MLAVMIQVFATTMHGGALILESQSGTSCNITVTSDGSSFRSSCPMETSNSDTDARLQRMQAEIDSLRAALETLSKSVHAVYYSCKDALAKGQTSSGVYKVNFGGSDAFPAYCDQDSNGGGWTLLLTVTDPTNNLPGDVGVSPFETPLNPDAPSLSTPYARVWNNAGVGLQPVVGDQVLLRRSSNGDWVRFVVGKWCGGADWHGYQTAACGSNGHDLLGLAHGELYAKNGNLIGGGYNFHSCSHVGGCGSSGRGGDGVGFSTHGSWLHGANNAYGGAYAGSGGADLFWAGVDLDADSHGGDTFTYFYREKVSKD